MSEGRDLVEEVVPLAGRDLRVLRPRDAEALIDEDAFEREERLPYWAELWPSGVCLAKQVAARSLRGARTLELGCGLGLPSMAAALVGGRVTASDWSEEAVGLLAENAARNRVELEPLVASWERPGTLVERAPWPLVLAADVLYERRNVPLLLELLPRLVDSSGSALVADPGRAPAEAFLEGARERFEVDSRAASLRPRIWIHRLRLRAVDTCPRTRRVHHR